MGYIIVLISDDDALRADPDAAMRDLAAAAGTDSYPTTLDPVTVGAWHRVGAAHSSGALAFTVDDARTTRAGFGPGLDIDDTPPHWVPQLTAGIQHRTIRDALHHPARMHRAMAQGATQADAVFGPDPLAGRTGTWSAWWVYADGISAVDRLAEHRDRIIAATRSHRGDYAWSGGSYANLLNKAGTCIDPAAPVALIGTGNRVCHPADLTEPERVHRLPQLR